MFDLVELLLRVMPGLKLDLVHAIGWGFYVAILLGLCALWRWSKITRYWNLSLAVTLSLFAAPHLHYHDLALLAVPMVGLGMVWVKSGKFKFLSPSAILTSLSLVLLFAEPGNPNPIYHSIPYLLMAALPALTWWYEVFTTSGRI